MPPLMVEMESVQSPVLTLIPRPTRSKGRPALPQFGHRALGRVVVDGIAGELGKCAELRQQRDLGGIGDIAAYLAGAQVHELVRHAGG